MSNRLVKLRFTRFLIPVIGLLVFSSAVQAASEQMPEAFEQSTLEDTVSIQSSGHLVLFSAVREVNNEIRSESMARLPVTGNGRLYRISRDSSREEARDHYRELLRQRNAQILFDCSSIRCGRSNVWANQIFNQAVLYGRDATQDYLVAATVADDDSRWLTLVYTVTRGNLREYVWVEHLRIESGAAIPGFGADNRIEGPIIVPWQGGVTYRFDWQSADRRRVNDLAREDGTLVALVGYSALGADESFGEAMERARRATESLSEVLSKTGVSRSQQEIIVVGPAGVFSDPDRQGDRVEVVVISR
ncbi:DUF4892 domain-containing protein [Marinobacter sp. F3R08]|uniref:DUF4892 domain-containing protein n=1 Tax=Marinobacter sp. F3R08 TaxID=2841559 RepID=UPI001C08F0F3|nr:DUF4892 domain-containing protein [Marinobacter sp. F3R08]MBU2955673.1 DUF4892 domain-containing protein [Marinobacter sp. F3R08]